MTSPRTSHTEPGSGGDDTAGGPACDEPAICAAPASECSGSLPEDARATVTLHPMGTSPPAPVSTPTSPPAKSDVMQSGSSPQPSSTDAGGGGPGALPGIAAGRLRFLERIQKSFSHDLRTPLGSIVNYAGVLETMREPNADEVRDLGKRIRGNAQRAARMVQTLVVAMGHASRPQRRSSTDLVALAAAVLSDAGGRGSIQPIPASLARFVEVDAELLGFAWRAFVAVENDARGQPLDELELRCDVVDGRLISELSTRDGATAPIAPIVPIGVTADPSRARPFVARQDYLRHNGGTERLECAMGFGLAEELVASHGGEVQVWGRPAACSGLRVAFPAAP